MNADLAAIINLLARLAGEEHVAAIEECSEKEEEYVDVQ